MTIIISGRAGSISQATFAGGPGSQVELTVHYGEAYIQYTASPQSAALNRSANWIRWPAGAVTKSTTDTLTQVVGLRLVVVSGSATMTIGNPEPLPTEDYGVAWISDARLKLRAALMCSLVPEEGPFPIYYRDPSGTGLPFVTDASGIVRQTVAGEAMFWGARRVQNLARYSGQLTFSGTNGWSAVNSCTVVAPNQSQLCGPDGEQTAYLITRANATANSILRSQSAYALRAVPHTFSVWLRGVTATTAELRLYISGGATLVTQIVNITTEWQRFSITGTPDGSSNYVYSIAAGSWASGASVSLLAAWPQLEEGSLPSEYVPVDGIPYSQYWYGAAVDGVQYFDTDNANTVNGSTGVVTERVGADLTAMLGCATFPSVQGFFLNSADMSSATGSNLTLTPNASASPQVSATSIRLTEDTSNTTHYAAQTLTGTNTYDGKYGCYSVYAKYTGGRAWIRLAILDIDGATTKGCFFNVQAGTVGTATHGTGYVEALANGWFRCIWSAVPLGAGASDASARIFMSPDGVTLTYLGTGATVDVWGPSFTTSLSAGGSDRPVATPYFHTGAAATVLPGNMLAYPVQGIIDETNFAVASEYSAYYQPAQPNLRNYSAVTYLRVESPVQNGIAYGVPTMDRTGLSIRPNTPASDHNQKLAWDFYGGDLNNEFFWRANWDYQVGDIGLDSTTEPDNANLKKMFLVVVPGRSGSVEPTWNSTYTFPPNTTSNLTIDNEVRWQVNENNGINGTWEPYLGAHAVPTPAFMEPAGYSWFITPDEYGCFQNGEEMGKATVALWNAGFRTVLRYRPKLLYLGQLGSNLGIPGALGAASASQLMSVWTAFHKNLRVYNARMTSQEVASLSS